MQQSVSKHRQLVYIFWLEYPLMHMAPLIKSLSKVFPVYVFYENEIPPYRKNMGFILPDFGDAKLRKTPNFYANGISDLYSSIIEISDKHVFHVFHGIDYCKNNYSWLKFLSRQPSMPCVVQLEANPSYGLLGKLRFMKACWLARRWRDKLEAIWAFGELGVNYYRRAGYSAEKIYEWRYYGPDERDMLLESEVYAIDEIDIVYVGALSERKNVSTLIRAISKMISHGYENLNVTIVGNGTEFKNLKALVSSLSLNTNVRFKDYMPNSEISQLLAQSKVLVLPSIFDGWGFVVNEALSLGCNVVISSDCGAASVVNSVFDGSWSVFESESYVQLAGCLSDALKSWSPETRRDNVKKFEASLSVSKGVEHVIQLTRVALKQSNNG